MDKALEALRQRAINLTKDCSNYLYDNVVSKQKKFDDEVANAIRHLEETCKSLNKSIGLKLLLEREMQKNLPGTVIEHEPAKETTVGDEMPKAEHDFDPEALRKQRINTEEHTSEDLKKIKLEYEKKKFEVIKKMKECLKILSDENLRDLVAIKCASGDEKLMNWIIEKAKAIKNTEAKNEKSV